MGNGVSLLESREITSTLPSPGLECGKYSVRDCSESSVCVVVVGFEAPCLFFPEEPEKLETAEIA